MASTKKKSDNFLSTVKDTYNLLDKHFDEIYEECSSEKEKKEFRDLYSSARDAYWKAIADGLEDNNTVVLSIQKDLRQANTKIKNMLKDLQDIVAFLQTTTEAVRLAASLAALAAAA